MNEPLPESKDLLKLLMNNEQREIIEETIKEIKKNPENYHIESFWKMDESIGGIGGYCMPFDAKINPFPSGIGRTLFRPLQYAASNIEIGKDIYNKAKYSIQESGLHLEVANKYVIAKITFPINPVRYKNFTLGKSAGFLANKNALSLDIIKPLELFVKTYNMSKHEVNQDGERERLFSPADALISYVSSRILGKEILKPYYSEILKIIGTDINRLDGLNMNI